MEYKIAIDADSIVYKACSRHKDDFDIEQAYYEFCGEIAKIKGAVFNRFQYEKGDEVKELIVLSPKESFRNRLYPNTGLLNEKGKPIGYKANRVSMKMEGIVELKKLILKRLKDKVLVEKEVEADDIVIYLANNHNYMVAAIDKDVLNVCPTDSYNYNTFRWDEPHLEFQIEQWYLLQTLMGDRDDNIPGAPGIGKAMAFNIVHGIDKDQKNTVLTAEQYGYKCTFDEIIQYFDSEYDAILNHMLVRMDQWNGKEVILWKKDKEIL